MYRPLILYTLPASVHRTDVNTFKGITHQTSSVLDNSWNLNPSVIDGLSTGFH
jgi:hypothetical protein